MKSNWPTKKLGEVVETITPQKVPIGTTPYVEIGDIDIETKKINFKEKGSVKGSIFAPTYCVIVSRVRPTRGAVALLGKKLAISSAFTILKSKSVLDLKFLFYYLAYNPKFFEYLGERQKGSNYPSCREKDILNFEIPLPPIKIQKRIVARIEELFEKIDKAKKLRQKALEEAGQIFPAALEEIFKKAVRKYSKQEIEEILELNQSGIWGDKPEELKNSYPVIRSTEITHEGELNLNSVAIRKIVPNKVSKYSLADGDILIVKSSGSANLIGRCSLFKQSKEDKKIYLFSNFIQRLRPNTKIVIPEFLYYFLNFEGKKFVQYLMTTTTGLRNLPIKQYVKLQIPHPSLPEQKKIVVYLDSLREKVDKLKQFQQSQLKELTELKQSILAKAFKG